MSKNYTAYYELLIDKIPEVNYYKKKLLELSFNWSTLNLLNQVNEGSSGIENTQEEFAKLTELLINNLAIESLKQLSNELNSKSQVVVDILIRNLFERTADIGFLATDDSIRDYILNNEKLLEDRQKFTTYNENNNSCVSCPEPFISECKAGNDSDEMKLLKNILCKNNNPIKKEIINKELLELKKDIKQRFEEYILKYSVYYDVILTDTKGNVLVNFDDNNKIIKTSDPIIQEAINTQLDYVEKLGKSDLRVDKESILSYSFKVTQNNDKNSKVIGVLILCFDFIGEMERIFNALKQTNENLNLMLLDKNGYIISSSNKFNMPIGTKMQKVLEQDFEILDFSGKKYIVKTANTKGYEGFFGLEWLGHVMIGVDEAFNKIDSNVLDKMDKDILVNVMHSSSLFSKELQEIPITAKKIQDDLNRTIWNGNLKQQTNISKKLLQQLSIIGEETKLVFNHSIDTLQYTVLQTILDMVSFQASLAIDIMDRNLYERANDCRWWALTPKFREILSQQAYENKDKEDMINILSHINDLYTVYTNLIVYDKFGEVIAVSKKESENLVGNILNDEWVKNSLSIKNSQSYKVSEFEKTKLYNNDYTYIYTTSILSLNAKDVVGGIAIVFDSNPQFKAILKDILPTNNDDSFALFATKEKFIISSTNENFSIGSIIPIKKDFFEIKSGESYCEIIELNDKFYAVGSRYSSGYREYKVTDGYSNAVYSLVFKYLCDKNDNLNTNTFEIFNQVSYEKDGTPIIEYGTFFIKNYWYGINTKELIGAVGIDQLQYNTQMGVIVGRTFYENELVEVIDLHKYLNISNDKNEQQQIVIFKVENNNKSSFIGIIVDALGAIVEVPSSSVQKAESLHFKTNYFVKEICKPPKENNILLSIIEPNELLSKLWEYQNN
jgi:chemotaxis signal transduction protein